MAVGEANGTGELDLVSTRQALNSSSTSLRVAHLHALHTRLASNVAHAETSESHTPILLRLLFNTYSRYLDRPSRHAVQRCIRAIISNNPQPEVISGLVKLIQSEAAKPGLAPGNAFVLVEWCSVLLQEFAGKSFWDKWGLDVISTDAQALELCMEISPRANVRHSALVVTRRALRKVFSKDTSPKTRIDDAVTKLTAKASQPTAKNAVILGVIAGVCARLSNCRELLAERKADYYTFYTREIIGSRTVLLPHVAGGLHDFFIAFATPDDIEKVLAPSIEKGLLRAPEIVLNDLLTPLLKSLPPTVDRSKFLRQNLLKHLLSNTKSSNPAVRQGALSAFRMAAAGCLNDEINVEIVGEIATPLTTGKVPSAEQRAVYAELLTMIPMSTQTAQKALPAIAAVSAKETNELAIAAESATLSTYLTFSIKHGIEIGKQITNPFSKGLADKKIPVRRLWALRLGDVFWSLDKPTLISSSMAAIAEAVLPTLLELYSEVTANPLAATQSGLVSAAFVVTAILPSKLALLENKAVSESVISKMLDEATTSEGKSSFLLNPKVYTKISTEDDLWWFSRALMAVAPKIVSSPASSSATAWSQAMIYCVSSNAVPNRLKQSVLTSLTTIYVGQPAAISDILINGVWSWRQSIELGDKTSPAAASKGENSELHRILKAICPTPADVGSGMAIDPTVQKRQLRSMLVLCRQELIPRINWIELCLRMRIDPGELVKEFADEVINQIQEMTEFEGKGSILLTPAIRLAAYNAAAELVFIAPEAITVKVLELIMADLDPQQLEDVGPLEVGILRTPEGTTFVDVLAKKSVTQISTKTKDYDTLKWEQELKAQLAQKKGQQKKLSPDETAKVNAQLQKEAIIRQNMRQLEARLERGLGIILGLAKGLPTDAEMWMAPVVRTLIAVMQAGAGLIVGDSATSAYIACANKVASRVGPIRPFIGIATLRAMNAAHLSEDLQQEAVESLITRVLYRLRFSGEQRKFDTVSLIYILPLILLVLRKGGFGEDEDADSQLVLALEFLSLHTDACNDVLVPREDILTALIQAMQSYNQHYKLIKDCLADLCRCVAPNINEKELSVLARGTIAPQVAVRSSILQSISAEVDMSDLDFSEEIWLACHDDADENAQVAQEIWEESGFTLGENAAVITLPYLEDRERSLRRAAARSIADCVRAQPQVLENILSRLEESYQELAKPRVSQLDEYGMPRKTDLTDPWEGRHGIASAFKELAVVFDVSKIEEFLRFLIEKGPLADKNASVRDEMVEAATAIVTIHGKSQVEKLMDMFEHTLETVDKSSESGDMVNEAVIILYGALARHLEADDTRVPKVVDRLLATLSTPSETVQFAVAECLPPLVQASSSQTSGYVERVLNQLFTTKKYAARRGAAYGLAGLVHGRGILALRELRIMSTLQGGAENKKDANQREGALTAYELLSTILGRLFEPYVIQIVPQLLASFGDSNADVRDACLAAAKACFASLSSYGVKQILPTLLEGLDDQQWRSKKGACDLLGAMAYLDPQQLAQSLPVIIPPLTAVLNDSHKEVRLAANRNLKRFGEVISNPEIRSLVDILLKALSDPTKYTDDALDSLIKVSFVHYLDAPSLALVVRILERGLGDRSATKRKSSQVIGSLSHLTERKDLVAHLPILVAGLKVAVVDPVPTTRATASKALGSLIEKLGEDALPDLIPGLMQTLKSDTGAGDRLGSAQALSEVLAGLGTSRLEETLPTILQNVASSKPSVREGFMSLFIFLPVCFGNSFSNYLGKIIPPILAGLADDVESIRETSLRAARLLVKNFATRAIDLLLPELERGLADDSYRIRLSSVELVGDLLFNLTGISANRDEEDDEEAAQEAGASLLEALGEEKRNKVLSSLYICRCDTAGPVRAAAINVWKVLVASPRTLKELIPTLSQVITRRLGSSNMEQKVIAGNALGELIRRAGDGVLATLLPTLEDGLQSSTDTDFKQGICMALRELISSASPEALEDHEKTLIAVVRTAITDADEDVREAAAEAFDSLQQIIGKRAVDQVLPHLLSLLRDGEEADNALSALLTLLTETTRANIILPNLVPTLLTPPVSSFNAKALASLAEVAGTSMTRRLPTILNTLMDSIIVCKDVDLRTDLEASFDKVLLSIDPYDGLNTTMSVLLTLVKHDDHRKRAAADYHLAKFFAASEIDYSTYNQDIVRALLISFNDADPAVVKAAWTALSEFSKKLKKDEMEVLVPSTRQVLVQVGVAGHNIAGFGLPKGINAILPIFLQGLMGGTSDQKIQSALAISDLIDRTSSDSLKPFVTQITGPLIRVVTEKSVDVKAAVLVALNNMLEKIPTFLKPFLPQLQRTFAKSLADPSSEILRNRAAKALGTLITITPRIDPLIGDLVTGSRTSDVGVRTAMLSALFEVISKAGANMNDTSRNAVLSLIDTEPDTSDVNMAITNARLLGALIKNLPSETASPLIKNRVMTTHFSHASVLALNAVLLDAAEILSEPPFADELPDLICQGIGSKNTFVSDNCVLAAGKFLLSSIPKSFEATRPLFEALHAGIQPGGPVDTRRLSLVVVRTLCRLQIDQIKPHVSLLATPIFASVRDPVIPVKLAAEAAFVALFDVVEHEGKIFDKYMAGPGAELPANTKRSMQDYFKRVTLRLGNQARERRDAEGGQGGLGLSSDEMEDEREIYSVGKVDLGEGVFSSD